MWKQTFTFDRYDNRNFDEANTTATTSFPKNCGTAPSLTVCTADRKIVNPEVQSLNNQFKADQDNDSVSDYLYDADGNLTRDAENRSFTYDGQNKQIEVKDSNNVSIGQYIYDGGKRRVEKIVGQNMTIYVYNAFGQLIAEYSTQAASSPQVNYLTTDTLGTARIITDNKGSVIARHDNQPFGGEILTPERVQGLGYAGDFTNQDFTGYQKDNETDLDFAQARYYSKILGRFYSTDPYGGSSKKNNPQTFNRYSYVNNNPLNFIDPSGLQQQNPIVDGGDLATVTIKHVSRYWKILTGIRNIFTGGGSSDRPPVMNSMVEEELDEESDLEREENLWRQNTGENPGLKPELTPEQRRLEENYLKSPWFEQDQLPCVLDPEPPSESSPPEASNSSAEEDERNRLLDLWGTGSTYENKNETMKDHFRRHGDEVGAKSELEYMRKAEGFRNNLRGARRSDPLREGNGVIRYTKNDKFIILDGNGGIISYGRNSR